MSEPYRITAAALPGILAEIARLTTVEAAIAVARRLGGRKLYVSVDPKPKHPLVKILGWNAGRVVCRQIGGDYIDVPSARAQIRKFDAVNLRLAGRSVREISEKLDISQSHAESLVRGVPKGDAEAVEAEDLEEPSACPVCGHRHRPIRARTPDQRQLTLFPEATPTP